jgi:hypothetical protein
MVPGSSSQEIPAVAARKFQDISATKYTSISEIQ